MQRKDTFTFRVNEKERKVLDRVAEQLQRSRGDTVRVLVEEAARELGIKSESREREV